jgi:hypothetical protein
MIASASRSVMTRRSEWIADIASKYSNLRAVANSAKPGRHRDQRVPNWQRRSIPCDEPASRWLRRNMKLLIVTLVVAASLNVQADPRDVVEKRAQISVAVGALATLDPIAPDNAAKVLGTKITATREVTPMRRESTLATGALWSTASATVGGADDKWRIVELVPALELELAHVVAGVADLPYQSQPIVGHPGNPHHGSTDHKFAGKGGELMIRVDTKGKISRILLTTDRSVPASSPSWKAAHGKK